MIIRRGQISRAVNRVIKAVVEIVFVVVQLHSVLLLEEQRILIKKERNIDRLKVKGPGLAGSMGESWKTRYRAGVVGWRGRDMNRI